MEINEERYGVGGLLVQYSRHLSTAGRICPLLPTFICFGEAEWGQVPNYEDFACFASIFTHNNGNSFPFGVLQVYTFNTQNIISFQDYFIQQN